MTLLRRHKTVLIALGIYWPAIFLLTHIPVPELARQSGMSDKTMHVLAYFVLSFLLWYAVSPYAKVNWAGRKVWVLIVVLTGYAVIDELLQGLSFIGRSSDVIDLVCNVLGIFLGFGILSVLNFWPSLLAVSSVFIFAVSNLSRLLTLYPQVHLNTVFHFTAYTAFTLICVQWLQQKKPAASKRFAWTFLSVLLPVLLLAMVKLSTPFFDKAVDWIDVCTALFGIISAVLVSFVLFRVTRRT